jgi:hypothetical protein
MPQIGPQVVEGSHSYQLHLAFLMHPPRQQYLCLMLQLLPELVDQPTGHRQEQRLMCLNLAHLRKNKVRPKLQNAISLACDSLWQSFISGRSKTIRKKCRQSFSRRCIILYLLFDVCHQLVFSKRPIIHPVREK